jgi:hypothetical protein
LLGSAATHREIRLRVDQGRQRKGEELVIINDINPRHPGMPSIGHANGRRRGDGAGVHNNKKTAQCLDFAAQIPCNITPQNRDPVSTNSNAKMIHYLLNFSSIHMSQVDSHFLIG